MTSKEFLTTGEAAKLVNISRSTISRNFDKGIFQGKKNPITGERLISRESLINFMKQYNLPVDSLALEKKRILVGSPDDQLFSLFQRTFSEDDRVELERVVFGGDVLTGVRVARFRELCPAATCVNFYGATETPQAVGCFVVADSSDFLEDDASSSSANSLSLGKGIDDVQLLVLNSTEQLAGIGEVGEIHVRTPHLAKGYLGDEALTQELFIVNPSTRTAGDILYKTGDLGRYLPNGDVQFIGRNDRQVKIRGFRVELGEIETVLAQEPGVREAFVLGREHAPGDTRLTAYLVPDQPQTLSANSLRDCARSRLPDYMVPSAFVILDAMPLTPNGKVDLDALPPPGSVKWDEPGFVSPKTPAETLLAEIWCELLDLDRVSIHDNFFDVGGHYHHGFCIRHRVCLSPAVPEYRRAVYGRHTLHRQASSLCAPLPVACARRSASDRRVPCRPG